MEPSRQDVDVATEEPPTHLGTSGRRNGKGKRQSDPYVFIRHKKKSEVKHKFNYEKHMLLLKETKNNYDKASLRMLHKTANILNFLDKVLQERKEKTSQLKKFDKVSHKLNKFRKLEEFPALLTEDEKQTQKFNLSPDVEPNWYDTREDVFANIEYDSN